MARTRKKKHAKKSNPRRHRRSHAVAHKKNPARKRRHRRNPGGPVVSILLGGIGGALVGGIAGSAADMGLNMVNLPSLAKTAIKIAGAVGGAVLLKKHPAFAAGASAGFIGKDVSDLASTAIAAVNLGGAPKSLQAVYAPQMQAVYQARQMSGVYQVPSAEEMMNAGGSYV